MEQLQIPFPDFRLGDIIDPDQFDENNDYTAMKINELIDFVNSLTGENSTSGSGASLISVDPETPFTATNLQELMNELINRLTSTDGSSLIGTPSLVKLAGSDVQAQLKSIDDLLQTAYVINSSIANGAITALKLSDNAVTTPKIGNKQVTSIKIADGNVGQVHLADSAVVSSKIAQDAVATSKIQNQAVTTLKIADSAVIDSKIANSAVTSPKIQNNSVTGDKVANSAIQSRHLESYLLQNLPETALSALIQGHVTNNTDLKHINYVGAIPSDLSGYGFLVKTDGTHPDTPGMTTIDTLNAQVTSFIRQKAMPNGIATLGSDGKIPLVQLPELITNLPNATVGQKGIVQLTDSLTSTSDTLAPTARALKSVNDELPPIVASAQNANTLATQAYDLAGQANTLAQEAFTQANDGKTRIGNVVGIPTNETFAQMESHIQYRKNLFSDALNAKGVPATATLPLLDLIYKIDEIQPSRFLSGSLNPSYIIDEFYFNGATSSTPSRFVELTGFDFLPKSIVLINTTNIYDKVHYVQGANSIISTLVPPGSVGDAFSWSLDSPANVSFGRFKLPVRSNSEYLYYIYD